MYTVKPELATTSKPWTPFRSHSVSFHYIKLPLDNGQLSTRATNFWSRDWSLCTGLTIFLKDVISCLTTLLNGFNFILKVRPIYKWAKLIEWRPCFLLANLMRSIAHVAGFCLKLLKKCLLYVIVSQVEVNQIINYQITRRWKTPVNQLCL
jgi:hypothetical protein